MSKNWGGGTIQGLKSRVIFDELLTLLILRERQLKRPLE
jgi:hypothetical protein